MNVDVQVTNRRGQTVPAGYRVVNYGGTVERTTAKARGKAARRAEKRARRLGRARRERRLARAREQAAVE